MVVVPRVSIIEVPRVSIIEVVRGISGGEAVRAVPVQVSCIFGSIITG